jgi:hypothetical protein
MRRSTDTGTKGDVMDPPAISFTNEGRVGVQAENFTVHGNNIVQLISPSLYPRNPTNASNLNLSIQDDRDLCKLLPYAAQAAFNTSNKQHASLCLADTRVDLLARVRRWADGGDKKCIFWLNGMAGTGKSTIAHTIAREYYDKGRLGASFFFSRGGGDLGTVSKVFTTIAVQLADTSPDLKRYICETLHENSDIGNLGLYDQWEKLVLQPLSRLKESVFPLPLVLVIDALDECEGKDNIRLILQVLATANSMQGVQLRIFITSRPETPIRHEIHDIPETAHQDFILHGISQSTIQHDISIFFTCNLEIIRRACGLAVGWPGNENIKLLVERAGGLFIYAATACRFIHEDVQLAKTRLDLILGQNSAVLQPEKRLDEIYTTIFTHSLNGQYDEQESRDARNLFGHIVGSIVVLFDTVSLSSLAQLLDRSKEEINRTLNRLHSVLDVPKSESGFIRLLHPSFRDFLLDPQRCRNPTFLVNQNQAHYNLFKACLRVMSNHLRRDMCGLRLLGARATKVNASEVGKCIPLHVQYACRYWVQHLQQSNFGPSDHIDIYTFLQTHFLFWLEALALMGCMSEGIFLVTMLDTMFTVSDAVGP